MSVLEVKKLNLNEGEILNRNSRTSAVPLSTLISRFEKFWFYLTLILAVMLITLFVFLLLFKKESSKTEKIYQRELRIQQMQNSLSTAVIDANQNNFEASRQTANDFFISLESELTLPKDSAFTDNQRAAMNEILKKKTAINQFLAEKNPKAYDELADIFETYQTTVKGFQPPKR